MSEPPTQSPGLVLHQFEVSPFAAKVRRALRYKQLPFAVRNYAVADAGLIRRTISPSGKTPVLEHEGRLIVDSTAILCHLEERWPAHPIYPADPAERGLALILEDWADESLFFYDLTMRGWPGNVDWLLRDVLSHDRGFKRWLFAKVLPKGIAKMTAAQGLGRKSPATVCAEIARLFDHLVAVLGTREFLVGGTLSVADIAVAAMCTVLARAAEAAALLAERPALGAWLERVDRLTFPADVPAGERAIR
jgi:glutathione S-transferase